jgi:predicted ArsR family transcriptional regulator
MSDTSTADRWQDERRTFQRVYDVLVGSQSFLTAQEFADRAECSETAARNALEQLAEMGVAERRDGRPARYRLNESYVRWKRVESFAREHSPDELQEPLNDLIATDDAFQDEHDVPDPAAVSTADLPVDDHGALHERWEDLSEWRTVRRDIRLLRRAVERAQ